MLNKRESQMKVWEEIANKLRSLAGESSGLTKKANKTFIVLERKLRKSDRHKNAVSLKREGVSFMVSNLAIAEAEATSFGFSVKPDPDFPGRLMFRVEELSRVASFSDFFSRLTKEAALHSEYLQSAGRHEKS